ncbi:unnamed protein product [Gordionus sp. m RMFG-2023]
MEAIVVDCGKVPLLGRMWLHAFNNILKTFSVGNVENDLEKVILTTKKDHESTYSYKLNMVRQEKVYLKLDTVPKIIHPRRVPYVRIDAMTRELDGWLKDNINLARGESRCPMPCIYDLIAKSAKGCLNFTKPSFGLKRRLHHEHGWRIAWRS